MTHRNYSPGICRKLATVGLVAATLMPLAVFSSATQAEPSKVTRIPIGARTAKSARGLPLGRRPITLDLRGADIQSVLRLFAERSGVNIVTSPNVTGSVTLSFKRVPLKDAFVAVLATTNLTWERVGDVIVVSPR